MKNTHLSKSSMHENASIDLPDFRVWAKIEEYVMKPSMKANSALKGDRLEKAEHLMDEAFDSIVEKLIRQN